MTGSMRERLRNRPLPSLTYPLLMDVDKLAPAAAALEQARAHLRQATLRRETWEEYRDRAAKLRAGRANREDYRKAAAAAEAEITDRQTAVEAAQAALDGCYEPIKLTALPPAEYEALRALHPAQGGEDELGDVDATTFRPALLEACAAGDMTVDDWTAFLAENTSTGEGQALYVAALMVNESPHSAEQGLGKGWSRTLA